MYIWTAVNFEDQLAELRNHTVSISEELALDNPSLTLPIHTSLAISFEAEDAQAEQIIDNLTEYFSTLSPFPICTENIEQNGPIIWLKMAENEALSGIHSHLIHLLQHRYGVQPHPFDLDFKFHATLFFGGKPSILYAALTRIKQIPLPKTLTARDFLIGTSTNGQPGTYTVCREISAMDQTLCRIRKAECQLDLTSEAVQALSDALEAYTAVQPQLDELIRYYESPQWLADYDADAAGLLPADLKRGVLSEDAVYDLLSERQRLLPLMSQLTKEIEEL